MSDEDTVGAWLARLLDGLARRAEEALASSRPARGQGWTLSDQSLQVEGERGTSIPFSELAEGRPITWTPALRLLPQGLEFTPKGMFGSAKQLRLLEYGRIQGMDLQDGTLHVWLPGSEKSVVQESTSADNFFPGLSLLSSLLAPGESEQATHEHGGDET